MQTRGFRDQTGGTRQASITTNGWQLRHLRFKIIERVKPARKASGHQTTPGAAAAQFLPAGRDAGIQIALIRRDLTASVMERRIAAQPPAVQAQRRAEALFHALQIIRMHAQLRFAAEQRLLLEQPPICLISAALSTTGVWPIT